MFSYLANWCAAFRARQRFRDYRPQPVTVAGARQWLEQYPPQLQPHLRTLLKDIVYLSEVEVIRALVQQNERLLQFLNGEGIPDKRVIYVSIDDAGSSSPMMLNLLRDNARLEQRGCRLIDSHDIRGLNRLTNELEEGAIVYVDDFVGTGAQFLGSRNFMAQHIVGNFAEFFILPCICEEAVSKLQELGVEPRTHLVHLLSARPLHEQCTKLAAIPKGALREACLGMDRRGGLGFSELATMVVLYRNAPNTTPRIFRGSTGQAPRIGIFPRTTDFPAMAVSV